MYKSDLRTSILFVTPTILLLLVVFIYPMFYSLRLSAYDYNLVTGIEASEFLGIRNYLTILQDSKTLHSLWLTFLFTVISVLLELILGFGLALALQEYMGLHRLVRTIIILPMMVSSLVVGLMWRLLWNADFGIINSLLEMVNLPRQFWLGPGRAFWSIIITEVWQNMPFVVLLVLAGLASLPREPYEAAVIDGASYFQSLWYLTLPLLRPILVVVVLFRTMFALRSIEAVWVLTSGGPADETMLFGLHIYRTAFRYFELGYSNALSWILLLTMAVFMILYLRSLPSVTQDYA